MDMTEKTISEIREIRNELQAIVGKIEKVEDRVGFMGMEYKDLEQEHKDLMTAIKEEFSDEELKKIMAATEKLQNTEEEEMSKAVTSQGFTQLLSILSDQQSSGGRIVEFG